MGIGNTTSSSAIASVLLKDPETVNRTGAGLSSAGLQKIQVIRQAIDLHHPDPSDPADAVQGRRF